MARVYLEVSEGGDFYVVIDKLNCKYLIADVYVYIDNCKNLIADFYVFNNVRSAKFWLQTFIFFIDNC